MEVIGELQTNQVIWQNGSFSATQDESGQWTASHTFKCRLQDVLNVIPRKGDSCTNNGWTPLKFITSTVAEEVGSPWAMVTCIYKGAISSDDGSEEDEDTILKTYNTNTSAQSEPIESHPNFAAMTAAEWVHIAEYKSEIIYHDQDAPELFKRKKQNDDGTETIEDVTLSLPTKDLITALDKGFTSWFSPRTTHTVRYTSSNDVAAALMAKVGLIAINPDGAPALPAGATWLFMGANTDNIGEVRSIELEYLASNPNGWDTDYYE